MLLRTPLTVAACLLALAVRGTPTANAQTPATEHLPGTALLQLERPLDVVMVAGINRFAEREIAAARQRRIEQPWRRDFSSARNFAESGDAYRTDLRERLGVVDPRPEFPRLHVDFNRHLEGTDSTPQMLVDWVSWDVLEGVTAEGLFLRPPATEADAPEIPAALVILLADTASAPEHLAGLSEQLPPAHRLGRRLVDAGCLVLMPDLIPRELHYARSDAAIRKTDIPDREYIYRMGFELGRHVVGYEIQKVLAAVDWFEQLQEQSPMRRPIVVIGHGEGGRIAMLSAAVDRRIDAAVVSGYFDERERDWEQPIDRNVWGLLTSYGDAEVASLIAPRPLLIENAQVPPFGALTLPPGHATAPGQIGTPDMESVRREFDRARTSWERLAERKQAEVTIDLLDATDALPFGEETLHRILQLWDPSAVPVPVSTELPSANADLNAARLEQVITDRRARQFAELMRHTQMLLHRSDKVREQLWSQADRSSVEGWVRSARAYRDLVHDKMIGRLPPPTAPLHPRSRKVIDEPTHVGYEVVLDVYPVSPDLQAERPVSPGSVDPLDPGVIAGGILLLPKDLRPGERRPVVVCQHGLEGTPMDTITRDESTNAWRAYKAFSTQLVERGFIVYAPQNPYRGEDEFRVIQRKSNLVGRSLFSYIIEQHRQTLRWLATLPYVDADRIGFYGLSYGGKTAVRVPPLLATPAAQGESSARATEHPVYCLSICSADFNEWIRKNCSAEDRYSYVFTKEYEIWEWNMGHIAGYANLSSLMTPRPFMVERGHGDGVAPDDWVGWEFANVRRHYDLLGLGDRTEIEWFNGPHTINGQGTFRFLHRHLNWPEPGQPRP